jgi:hypothetical protein
MLNSSEKLREVATAGKIGEVSACAEGFNSILSSSEKIGDEVELIWWPRAFTRVVTHTDIRIGEPLYSAFLGMTKVGDFQRKYDRAIAGKGKVFFRFKLDVNHDQFLKLKEIVDDPTTFKRRKIQSCVGGACKMLREEGIINIPFPFSQVPTLNALYLIFLKRLGHKKILKVEYVGPSLMDVFTKYEPALEIAGVAGTIGLIVWSINGHGEVEQTVVPVSSVR